MSSALTPGLRLVLGGLGAGAFGAGVAAVFVTENGTGTGVLIAFGGAVLVLGILGNRIESLEFGGTKLRLRAAAAERFALAEESERRGDGDEANRLRLEAQTLLDAAGPIAADYQSLRASMRPGPDRTRALEGVMARARRQAQESFFDAAEVARWLRDGSDEERVTALGMMQAKPELRDFDGMLMAIDQSRSAFEQYHALRLAVEMVADLDASQRRQLADVVKGARGMRLRRDSDRWRLSEEILRRTS